MRDIADDLTIARDADDLTIASGMSDLPVARDDLPVVVKVQA
ncbi:hypothetical protein O7A70_15570 [Mesorhizobium sp. Cs1299R1N1]